MIELNKVYNEDNSIFVTTIPDNFIDLTYCDILFNTWNKFIDYNDSFSSINEALIYYNKLFIEIKRVLKSTGLVYIHCDYNLSHYIKLELDNIFGINNFRNEIIWWYNSAPRKKNDFGKRHETIFRYSKSKDYYFNKNSKYIRQPYSETAPRGYAKEKYYDNRGKILDDVWKIPILGQNDKTERVGYSTQKPEKLLYPIIDSSCPEGGIVLDLFCGSGTTCVVAKKLNRNFLACDINKKAVSISNDRLERIFTRIVQ
jgi:site-specific DNA-methyltransferase (adenine-specific)